MIVDYDPGIDAVEGFTRAGHGEAQATQGVIWDKDRRVKVEFVRAR